MKQGFTEHELTELSKKLNLSTRGVLVDLDGGRFTLELDDLADELGVGTGQIEVAADWAKDEVGGTCIAPVGIVSLRTKDQVIESVSIDIARTGGSEPRKIIAVLTEDGGVGTGQAHFTGDGP